MTRIKQTYLIDAKDTTGKASKSAQKNFGAVQSKVLSLGTALVGVAGVGGFAYFINKQIDAADETLNFSKRIGISTEALSQYGYVAKVTGVSVGTLNTSLQRMTRRVSEAANGTGEAVGALKELGIDVERLNALKPDQQFEAIAEAMQGVTDQGDKVRLAMKLFDTEGVALLQTMEGGAAAIRELRQEADSLGLTLSQANAQELADAKKSIDEIKAAAEGLGVTFANTFGGTIANVMGFISDDVIPSFSVWLAQMGIMDRTVQSFSLKELEAEYRNIYEELRRLEGAAIAASKGLVLAQPGFGDPADQITQQIEAKRKELEAINELIAQKQQQNTSPQNTPQGLFVAPVNPADEKADTEAEKLAERLARRQEIEQAALQAKFEALQNALFTEEELEAQQHTRRLELINERFEQTAGLELSKNEFLEREKQRHLDKLFAMEGNYAAKSVAFERATQKQKNAILLGELRGGLEAAATFNKSAFKANKIAAGAEAAISTYQGIAGALKLPFPLNLAAAAKVGLVGFAQISKINASSYGGGGGSVSIPNGSSINIPSNTSIDIPQNFDQQEEERQLSKGTTTIQFLGNVYGLDDFQDRVVEAVQDQTDKDVVIIAPNSRQAQELANA